VSRYDSDSVGTVTTRVITQQVIDVTVDPIQDVSDGGESEIILRVNGRIIRRLNSYQARRMGIIAEARSF
jgi:hypothetical protein